MLFKDTLTVFMGVGYFPRGFLERAHAFWCTVFFVTTWMHLHKISCKRGIDVCIHACRWMQLPCTLGVSSQLIVCQRGQVVTRIFVPALSRKPLWIYHIQISPSRSFITLTTEQCPILVLFVSLIPTEFFPSWDSGPLLGILLAEFLKFF